ncbi:CapA family protein [Anoxybacterium hadale]|uniref:CapA family protein n=1 Tax=Anoxybacterium hadale TaxID=3408580 RepID=A0ACD1ACT5_9FIRM|nr:CapA family protein [Clostridiales bacterium]
MDELAIVQMKDTIFNHWKKIIIIAAASIIAVGLYFILPPLLHGQDGGQIPLPSSPAEPAPADEPEEAISLRISAVGDVMAHKSQLTAQYDSSTGTYNFDNNFQYLIPYINQADLALFNLETTFAGGTYTGYPAFNAPESLASAMKNAGFDVALTSNNHIMDKGLAGMKRTLEMTRKAGLNTAGTRLDGEKNYTIVEVKGVKIGVVAYSYETPKVGGVPTINGSHIAAEAWPLLNTFSYWNLDQDLLKVKQSIQDARADGAELVICYYHWGEEYQRSPNDYQQNIARQTAGFGADIIFASHPHVLQGMELLTDASGKKVPVYYSMGNLISNQRLETLDNRYTEQGMIAEVDLQYMKSTKQILTIDMKAVPTWVDKYKKNGKDVYAVIPLDSTMSTNQTLAESGHLSRAQQALTDIKTLLGEEYIRSAP